MNTTTIGASHIPGLFETQPLRLRAELPALPRAPYATHDFLVPNPRPDLTGDVPAQPARAERRSYIEPDSMFWHPEAQADDAA